MNTVRLAVIGAGLIGRKHAELIAAGNSCSLAGICDIDPGKISVAEKLKVRFYHEIEELLEREQPHGAIIATPNARHSTVAEICARQSVHLLIEKLVAVSVLWTLFKPADYYEVDWRCR